MNLQDLLDKNLIEPFVSSSSQIKQKISLAEADMEAAKDTINNKNSRSVEWAYAQAYNVILQTGTALIYSRGHRPKKSTGSHHWAVELYLKSEFKDLIHRNVLTAFGNARQNRNEAVYDQVGLIGKTDAEGLIKDAESFLITAKTILGIK